MITDWPSLSAAGAEMPEYPPVTRLPGTDEIPLRPAPAAAALRGAQALRHLRRHRRPSSPRWCRSGFGPAPARRDPAPGHAWRDRGLRRAYCLWLHDDTFIKWKPSRRIGILAALVLGSQFIGKKTTAHARRPCRAARRRLEPAQPRLGFVLRRPRRAQCLRRVLLRPRFDEATRTATWVNFKVFGLMGLTLLFVVVQAFYMARHMPVAKPTRGTK